MQKKPTYIRLDEDKKEQLAIVLMLTETASYQQFFESYVDQTLDRYKSQIEQIKKIQNEGR